MTYGIEKNDIDSLKKIFKENKNNVACVIMEPMNTSFPVNNFLNKVKELTHDNGAILIFDEVLTGFRFSLGGAQEYFDVIPDLATFGKGIYIQNDIVHLSDTDTKIAFSTDSIGFSAGNKTHLTLTTSAIEFNKDNLDIDFVIRTTNTSNIFYVDSASDNIGIGTSSPGVTSILDIASTTQGLSVPRMTTAQMNAILGPTAGMVVYATDGGSGNGKLMIRTSAAWETITSS